MRSKKRFFFFTAIYAVLIGFLSFFLQQVLSWGTWGTDEFFSINPDPDAQMYLLITTLAALALAIMYAWIIINQRRMEIATLKCIGWTNKDVGSIISSEIMWVTFIGAFVVFELLTHFTAGTSYYWHENILRSDIISQLTGEEFWDKTEPILSLPNMTATVILFLVVQVIGIKLMYRKVLKLRPIMALRVMQK